MITVYKYPIQPSLEKIELRIPGGGPILSAGLDPIGVPCIWAIANTDDSDEIVTVYCVGTGWPLDWIMEEQDNLNFVDTIKQGIYVWHVFTANKGE